MTDTKTRKPLGGLTLDEFMYFQLAKRFRITVAKLMYDEFPRLAIALSHASVRRAKDEPLAWEISDATERRTGHVYDLMRMLPELWEHNESLDLVELREWVLEAERLERVLRPEPRRKHPEKTR
jgi:hypothetical protein